MMALPFDPATDLSEPAIEVDALPHIDRVSELSAHINRITKLVTWIAQVILITSSFQPRHRRLEVRSSQARRQGQRRSARARSLDTPGYRNGSRQKA